MKINYWQNLEAEQYYHIYNRSIGSEKMFVESPLIADFLRRWEELIAPYSNTLAYCIMSNHFHFICQIRPLSEEILAKIEAENTVAASDYIAHRITYNDFLVSQFSRLFNGFGSFYNGRKKRHGGLFQKKFKRICLSNIPKILDKICYVHHNPIHHGAASYYDGWRYSSFNDFLNEEITNTSKKEVFMLLKELRFIEAMSDDLSSRLTGIYEYPTSQNIDIQNFVLLHSNFHQVWMSKQKWNEYDDLGEF